MDLRVKRVEVRRTKNGLMVRALGQTPRGTRVLIRQVAVNTRGMSKAGIKVAVKTAVKEAHSSPR